MNDILGIKYLASPSKKSDTMYQFTKLTEDGELALYYNENALSLGFMVKDDIKDWDIEAVSYTHLTVKTQVIYSFFLGKEIVLSGTEGV